MVGMLAIGERKLSFFVEVTSAPHSLGRTSSEKIAPVESCTSIEENGKVDS